MVTIILILILHIYIYIYIYIYVPDLGEAKGGVTEGGMIRMETLIELKFINSSFSSSNFSVRAVRAYPLIEIRRN